VTREVLVSISRFERVEEWLRHPGHPMLAASRRHRSTPSPRAGIHSVNLIAACSGFAFAHGAVLSRRAS